MIVLPYIDHMRTIYAQNINGVFLGGCVCAGLLGGCVFNMLGSPILHTPGQNPLENTDITEFPMIYDCKRLAITVTYHDYT